MNQKHFPTYPESSRFLPLLVILFIGSGCAALIYEVIWLQMLQMVIGLTSISLGVLLGTFMGGMCLGSLLLPRLISIKHHPLKVYAVLELCTGLLALLILFGMPFIENVYSSITGYGLFQSVLLRSVIAAICLLPPTILMGATLPAISRLVESTPKGVSWMGFFYGGNIFGAVAGCLLAGFYLLRVFDIAIATYVAFFINITVAAGAIMIARFASHKYDLTDNEPDKIDPATLKVVYIAIALSGMAALGGEVIWTRLLSIMLVSTVYTFSIILAAFLTGLGIGSGAGALISRNTRIPGLYLGICQLLLILAIAWTSYHITHTLPDQPLDPEIYSNPWFMFQLDLAGSALAVLPPAILWGASFPLALAAMASHGQDPGRMVGRVYASNTIGAIIGSLAFSMFGIPVLGTAISQKVLVLISGVAAILMFSQTLPLYKFRETALSKKIKPLFTIRFAIVSAGIVFLIVMIIRNITTVPWYSVAYGRYMSNYNYLQALNVNSSEPMDLSVTPLYVGEGLNGTVAVTQLNTGERQFHSVGKVQASTDYRDMRLQRMLGHISSLLTDNLQSVLVVGCGAGITAGSFVTYPDVKKIVICDIESLVPRIIAPMFSDENYGIADGIIKENPHTVNGKEVRFENDDGRHYLSTSSAKFDIISSDPIDPWAKGAAALYSVEFFTICKNHLNPGGAVSLWVPLYENSNESVKSMISTFFKVFPDGIIWSNDNNGKGYDLVLFGQVGPAHIDIEKLEKRFNNKDYRMVRQSLADVGFYHLENLLGTYAGRASDLKDWMEDAQINTDKNLRLSYLSGMAVNAYQATSIFEGICKYYKFPADLFYGSEQKLESLEVAINKKLR